MRDLIIMAGWLLALGFGLYGAVKNRDVHFKAGSIIAALAACDGLVHFGWLPYLGGANLDAGTYFGCVMLTFSILAWLLFRGLSSCETVSRQEEPKKPANVVDHRER